MFQECASWFEDRPGHGGRARPCQASLAMVGQPGHAGPMSGQPGHACPGGAPSDLGGEKSFSKSILGNTGLRPSRDKRGSRAQTQNNFMFFVNFCPGPRHVRQSASHAADVLLRHDRCAVETRQQKSALKGQMSDDVTGQLLAHVTRWMPMSAVVTGHVSAAAINKS